MSVFRTSIVLVATTLVSLVVPPRIAFPCDPGPIYRAEVTANDMPECATVTPRRRVSINGRGGTPDPERAATLDIDNRCSDAIDLAPTECAACGPATRIEPGTSAAFVIENRPQSDAIDYGKTTKQVLRWTAGTRSGALTSEVTVRDDLEACRDKGQGEVGGEVDRAFDRAVDRATSGCG